MTDTPPERFSCTVRPDPDGDGPGGADAPLPPNTLPIGRQPRVEVDFPVRAAKPVLLEMVARGVRALDVGCRGGGCGVCRVQVVEGEYETQRMSKRHVSDEERAAGYALSCRLLARSDLVVRPAPSPR